MERRVEFLTEQGLAKKQGGRVVFARNLIVTLRKREIEKIASKIERETRIAHRPTKQGEYLSGTYSKVSAREERVLNSFRGDQLWRNNWASRFKDR